MDTREIAKQQQACLKSLHLLYKESQQTLALLSLVVQSPSDAEPRNRLEPQIDKEDRARSTEGANCSCWCPSCNV